MTALLDAFLRHTLDGATPTLREGALPVGGRWQWLGDGMLLCEPADPAARNADLLLSAGVHGDETAPIEVCDALVRELAAGRQTLTARVLFLFGNLPAMRAFKRYLDDDLNRLFDGRHAGRPDSAEARRAAELEAAARNFFLDAPAARSKPARLHYDLHTAIRGSRFERFALYPYRPQGDWNRDQLDWLAGCGVEAVLLNQAPAGTFSYFTSARCDAHSFTLELGKVRPFGENDLSRFAGISAGLSRVLAGDLTPPPADAPMRVFQVAGEIIKHSDDFHMHVASDVENFTPFVAGTVLAEDGDYRYVVSNTEERIVFPNPKVKNGLRAGLMVVETSL